MRELFKPYSFPMALWLSLAMGSIHTGLMMIGHAYVVPWSDMQIVLISWITNCILYLVLFLVNFSIIKKPWRQIRRLHVSFFLTLSITAIYTVVSQWIQIHWLEDPLQYLDIIKDGLCALSVYIVMLVLNVITRHQQMVLENEHLQAENLQVRLNSLVNQVDPHFLFNSLNTLDGLIGTDDSKAHQYLQQLASSYRYIMKQHSVVTLQDELQFAENYLSLMQIRYGSNLQVVWNINPHLTHLKVLPISLQLLIENAIKHNVVSDRHPLTITIETTHSQTLRVSNPLFRREDEEGGSGLGLANLNNRYQLIAHRSILIQANSDIFAVEIPLFE